MTAPAKRPSLRGMEGYDQVAVKHVLPPEEYEQPEARRRAQQVAQNQFAAFMREHGYSLLDSPVGRWEHVQQEFDEGDIWHRWEYRLLGWATK